MMYLYHSGLFKYVTYSCDDGSSKEEGAAHVPVAGVVGCVAERTHSCTHSIYGMLGKSKEYEL